MALLVLAVIAGYFVASYRPNLIGVPFYMHRDIGGGGYKPDHTRVRGKTYPQHGARECARRVRQMERAAANAR